MVHGPQKVALVVDILQCNKASFDYHETMASFPHDYNQIAVYNI